MNSKREIVYLSPPAAVSMADPWFDIASLDHFWVRRRFEVVQKLAGQLLSGADELAEIGCGNGLLQRQIEDRYGRKITGFDLNEYALKRTVSQQSTICCYDILDRDPALLAKFDLILLFDVLEHVADEDRFLAAILHHLAPAGKVVVNVPAVPWAYSGYDRAAGHVRRYSSTSLKKAAKRNHFEIVAWTYWGLPLLLPLIVRKLWLSLRREQGNVIAVGFDSRTAGVNALMRWFSRCEFVPQKLSGSSLMAVLKSAGDGSQAGSA